jgi:23S rRNA (pseudouridine1915-N3)-methyltransferase
MRLRVLAVGDRMPEWVNSAFEEYAQRFGSAQPLQLRALPVSRQKGTAGKGEEGQRLIGALEVRDFVVVLDEHGKELSTLELARWLEQRRAAGGNVAFLIGGADGLSDEVLARADLRWSLSRLTLPHALVRVLVAEQLYRAGTLLSGHPYHRA